MSAQTQGSNASQPGGMMKIKITYKDDLIAIRLPKDVSFVQLQDKLQERLGTQLTEIEYKDEPTGQMVSLQSDQDLSVALSRNQKLWLYAYS